VSVYCDQLYEYTFWGATTSNPINDPNLRLEAYTAAARRGAQVRILLDSVYDDPADPRGNIATCAYVNGLASSESLDLACKTGNPTGAGIHNKMVLVNAGGQGCVHTGSINGSENSSKNNREFAVQVQSDAAYNYLASVFWDDSRGIAEYLPIVLNNYPSPTPIGWCSIMCTPPACRPDEEWYCPGSCPCGCGTRCATRTPVPRAESQLVTPASSTPIPLVAVVIGLMGYVGLMLRIRGR
jgi:hypothetical protein